MNSELIFSRVRLHLKQYTNFLSAVKQTFYITSPTKEIRCKGCFAWFLVLILRYPIVESENTKEIRKKIPPKRSPTSNFQKLNQNDATASSVPVPDASEAPVCSPAPYPAPAEATHASPSSSAYYHRTVPPTAPAG